MASSAGERTAAARRSGSVALAATTAVASPFTTRTSAGDSGPRPSARSTTTAIVLSAAASPKCRPRSANVWWTGVSFGSRSAVSPMSGSAAGATRANAPAAASQPATTHHRNRYAHVPIVVPRCR